MNHIWTDSSLPRPRPSKRTAERRPIWLPARLTWKDQRGTTRFASVVTRNVSELGVFVECQSAVSIPLYRLVQFQLEREAREGRAAPGRAAQRPRAVGGLPRHLAASPTAAARASRCG